MDYTNYTEFETAKVLCRACPIGNIYDCVVPSFGKKDKPRVVFIGECPGENELVQREPFCGRSGKVLRQVMNLVGFRPHNTLITNTMPCRPLNNQYPKEIKIVEDCMERWLLPELRLTDPDFIVLVGSKALTGLLGVNGISKYRGQWLKLPSLFRPWHREVRVMATFHPSYLLRLQNAGNKEAMTNFENDLRTVAIAAGFVSA